MVRLILILPIISLAVVSGLHPHRQSGQDPAQAAHETASDGTAPATQSVGMTGSGITNTERQNTGSAHAEATTRPVPARFTEQGELMRPRDYRTWVFIGAPLTPNDMNNGHAAFPEFHNVYLDPQSYEHYRQTGEFRDGSVIVKELVSVATRSAPSGNGYFEGEFLGLEAMVRDRGRFADEPGNWGFFRFTDEEAAARGELGNLRTTATVNRTVSCASCHTAGGQDYVFTQYYPVLRAARGAKRNPENP